MNQIDPKMIQSFAPTGTLRVGINLGNPVLAGLDAATQKPKGVTIDIANEIGKRSGIPIELVPFQTAGSTVDAIKTGNIDMIFVAIDRCAELMSATRHHIYRSKALIWWNLPLH